MIIRKIPSRRALLEENRSLRQRLDMANERANDILYEFNKDTDLIVIGNRMAKRLRRSSSPATKTLVAEWEAAREA